MLDLPDDLMTPREAAKLLRCHLSCIHRWIQKGKLPAWRVNGERYLVSRAALLALVTPVTFAQPRVQQTRAAVAEEKWVYDVLRKHGVVK